MKSVKISVNFRVQTRPSQPNESVGCIASLACGHSLAPTHSPHSLALPRKVALRPHDECNGSDVFGTDICTCRPYLVYAIQKAAECAQRGGCGLIVYYRKEGRALGEVTKFRVYNARTYQEGGDRPETYFKMTENIAGIEDARCQELMPDVLKWLGTSSISTKYYQIYGHVTLDSTPFPRDQTDRPPSLHVQRQI